MNPCVWTYRLSTIQGFTHKDSQVCSFCQSFWTIGLEWFNDLLIEIIKCGSSLIKKWKTAKYSDLGICALHWVADTQQWTHTHTHQEQVAVIYAAAPREQLGVRCLPQGNLSMVLKMEKALYIHSPHLQFLTARDSNLQPLDYESDALTIRPQLPFLNLCFWINQLWTMKHSLRLILNKSVENDLMIHSVARFVDTGRRRREPANI